MYSKATSKKQCRMACLHVKKAKACTRLVPDKPKRPRPCFAPRTISACPAGDRSTVHQAATTYNNKSIYVGYSLPQQIIVKLINNQSINRAPTRIENPKGLVVVSYLIIYWNHVISRLNKYPTQESCISQWAGEYYLYALQIS